MYSHFNTEDGGEKKYFQYIMLYYFSKGKNATEMQQKICALYGKRAVTEQICQKWFVNFCAGDFLLYSVPQSGRPGEVDNNQIETLIKNNEH